jgi:nitrate reductase delta subunit
MVDLRARYLDAGLEPEGNELPDYLPLFLDYCSTLPVALARDTLAEPGVVLIALTARLADKGSDYAPLFALLCEIAGLEMDEAAANALPPVEDPETLEELDAQWEEEEIRFTADAAPDPNAACPQVSAILDRMRAPLPATASKRS